MDPNPAVQDRSKFMRWVVPVFTILIIVVGAYLWKGQQYVEEMVLVNNQQLVQHPTVSPTLMPVKSKGFTPVFSGDKKLFVDLLVTQIADGIYEFKYRVWDWEGIRRMQIASVSQIDNVGNILATVTFESENVHYQQVIENEKFKNARDRVEISADVWEHLITISESGMRIGILQPDGLAVMDAEVEVVKNPNYDDTYVSYSHIGTIDFDKIEGNVTDFFFSGDEEILYIITRNQVHEYKVYGYTSGQLETYDIGEGRGFVPLESSNKLAFVSESTEVYGAYSIHYFNPEIGAEEVFNLPGKGYDWLGNLKFSPNHELVCYETQSSGFHGYDIYRLADMRLLDDGKQYSYCGNWLDNSRILVRKKPYNNPTHVTHQLLLDVYSGDEAFISVVE